MYILVYNSYRFVLPWSFRMVILNVIDEGIVSHEGEKKKNEVGTSYTKKKRNNHGKICLNITRIVRIWEFLPVRFDVPNLARVLRDCTIWWEFTRRCYIMNSHFYPFVLVLKQLINDYISWRSYRIKFWYKEPNKTCNHLKITQDHDLYNTSHVI